MNKISKKESIKGKLQRIKESRIIQEDSNNKKSDDDSNLKVKDNPSMIKNYKSGISER